MTEKYSSRIKYEDVKDITPEEFFKGAKLSIDAFKNKYLIHELGETTPAQVFWRVATYAASKEETEELREYWSRRWFHEMWVGEWMPAGSILQGAANPNKVSLVNCTHIYNDKDSLEEIFGTAYQVAKVAAYRQGLGIHSNLRPKGARINNSSHESQGNTHWMKFWDNIGNYVGQLGRIPAFLISISDTNPDLLDFITVKSDQTTISNANISVQFSDAFMRTLKEDGIWEMKYVVEDTGEEIVRREPASKIFEKFVENNYFFAEPGAQFVDTIRRNSNSDYLGDERWKVKGSNACSEQFLEYVRQKSAGVCFLSSANFMYLYRLFKDDITKAANYLRYNTAPSMHRFVDNLIDKEIEDKRYPIEEQYHSLINLRRMGIGITNLDGYLIYNGIGYDTDEGVDTIFKLMDSLNVGLYESSINLGKERGSFLAFDREKYIQSPFIKQMMERHGLQFEAMRNVCLSSIAPTGSLSLMFPDHVSYGIEPVMGLYYWKRHRTSGKWQWTFVVPSFVREILSNKGVDLGMDSDSIEDDDNGSRGEVIAAIIDKHLPRDKFKPAHRINPFKKVELMSKLTKYCVDSSISVTYNLPEDVSKETIRDLYIKAWEQEVKSIAIYRDKSRVGVVEFESPRIASKRYSEQQQPQEKSNTAAKDAQKRPESLLCDVYHLTVRGEKWISFVGIYDDRPYEIFAGKEEELSLPRKYKKGELLKKNKKYFFVSGDTEEDLIKVSVTDSFKNDEHSALTRQISLSLRHEIPLVYIIDQLDKSQGTIVDYSKVLMRVLKNYLKEEEAVGKIKCSACGSRNLTYQEKCFVCLDCGSSKCS